MSELQQVVDSLGIRLRRSQERELLRDLLSGDPIHTPSAAKRFVDGDLLSAGRAVAFVLRPVLDMPVLDEESRLAIDKVLAQTRRTLPPGRAVHLARPDHGLLVVTVPAPPTFDLEAIGERLRDGFLALRTISPTERVLVGVGDLQGSLAETADSYREATQAARVAEVMPAMGDVARWADLGIYRLLIQLPPEQLTSEALPAGLLKLLEDESSDLLVSTLERYLDFAGSVKETAAALNIHRTTLYYRLSRVEELAGVDLDKGAERLVLHLGIKVAHLVGLYPRVAPSRS